MFKNFLITCAQLLNRDDLVNAITKHSSLDLIESQQIQNDILRLIHYYNHSACALCEHYAELSTTETFVSNENSVVEFSTFTYSPVNIIGVYDEQNHPLKFFVNTFSVKTLHANKTLKITYSFTPPELKNFTDKVILPKRILQTLSYAVVSEFFASKELFKESNYWQSKFTNQLFKLKPSKERRLKSTF